MSAAEMIDDRHRLGDLGPRLSRLGVMVGVAGLAASALVAALADHGWPRFFRSYLVAFVFVLTLALGGMFWTALQHATRAGWSVVLRRLAEGAASNLRWIWVLFIPVAIGMYLSDSTHLYHWATQEGAALELIQKKSAYLDKGFWLVRAAAFFTVLALVARFYCNASVAQDRTGEVQLTHRMQWFAPLALLLYALIQSYAAFDWIMSLEAEWFSTMFGVYFFAATTCGFFSFLILAVFYLQRKGRVINEITVEHYQDMGKQLFAFGVVFWAYIAFSQYMLIWYANIPEETTWYMARQLGPWVNISLLLLVGHFVLPFLFLITRHTKRMKPVLAGAAAWMLFMHYIDLYWMIMPRVPHDLIGEAASYRELAGQVTAEQLGYGWHLLDLTCLVGLAGLFVAGTARWLGQAALVPEHDPRLQESLAFENM